MYRATITRVEWIESSGQRAPLGSWHPFVIYRYGSESLMWTVLAIASAFQFLLRSRGARAHLAMLVCAVALAAPLTGCTSGVVTHDPAVQKQVDNKSRYNNAIKLYAIVERQITAAYQHGAISKADDEKYIGELQTVIHPALGVAKDALITGDFVAAITKVETMLTALSAKVPAATPAR